MRNKNECKNTKFYLIGLFAILSVSCGGGGGDDGGGTTNTSAPVVNDFTINSNPAYTNSPVQFNWDVSDINGGTLTCLLDVNNDGTAEYTINDCGNTTTQNHLYSVAGAYSAKLTVSDTSGLMSSQTLSPITIFEPLSVNVSVANNPVASSTRVLYNITLANRSLNAVDSIETRYTVPTGLNFHLAQDAEPNVTYGCGTCYAGNEAVWEIGTLAAGESETITINANAIAGLSDGMLITAPIRVSATGIDTIVADKTVSIYNSPETELALSASTDPVIAGETFTYNIDVGNVSAGTLTTLQLKTLLPSGVSVVSISDGGSEVTPGEIVWNASSLGVTNSLHREVIVTANSNLVGGTILAAQTQLTHDGGLAVDNISEHAVTVVASTLPLKVDISAVDSPVVIGKRLRYNMTLSNPTALPIDGINVLARGAKGLNFHLAQDAEPNVTSGCGTCYAGNEAVWDIGTLAPGESKTITVNANVIATTPAGSLITLPFRITASNQLDTINLVKVVRTYAAPEAELTLSSSTDPVTAGETFTYNIDVGNVSAGTLTTLQLKTLLPSGVSVVSISDGGSEVTPGEIVWNASSLGVTNSLHREVTVTADSNLVGGMILAAQTQLTHDGSLEVDNISEHAVTVVASALPLKVDISVVESPVVIGKRLRYNVTLSNPTALPVDGINVLARGANGLNFHLAQDAEPNVTSGCGTCYAGNEAVWDIGTLAPGESRTITVNANVIATTPPGSLIALPFRITASNQLDTIDLVKVVSTYPATAADLTLSASTDPVTAGETFTYNIDVGNVSAGTLTTLQLKTLLPSGVSVVSISGGGTEVAPGEIVWNASSLGVTNSLHREVTVTADSNLVGGSILAAKTQLTHDGGLEVDNVSEHAVTVVDTASQLSLDISAIPYPVAPGGTLTYSITLNNNSSLPADVVNLIMRVQDGMNFHYSIHAEPDVTSGCGTCYPGNEALWSLGTLAAGSSVTITVNASVNATTTAGTLIATPFRVTSSGQMDTIEKVYVVPVQ